MKTYVPGDFVPTKWFRFLKSILLPISFLFQMVQILNLRLVQYNAPETWSMYNTIDLVYTLISLVLTVLTFLWMRKFKWKGIQVYFGILFLSLVYSLLCTVLYMIDLHVNWFTSLLSFFGTIVMLIVNGIYFKKRKFLFAPYTVDPEPRPAIDGGGDENAPEEDGVREEDMYIEDYDEEYFQELCQKLSIDTDADNAK